MDRRQNSGQYVVAGSSHARRLSNALTTDGHTANCIRMPGYGPNRDTVDGASEELCRYLADNRPATVVYNMLDSGVD